MNKTILIVDDFTSIRDFMREMLNGKGYSTISAANGEQAYSMLLENHTNIDLVISDYNMPDGSGIELLKKIKANDKVKQIPVVFLSIDTDEEKMREAKNAGLAAWIKKPFKSMPFFAQIEMLMTNT